jgi:hypothetical protein
VAGSRPAPGRRRPGRVGGHYLPCFAARDVGDVALDRGDHRAARDILADLDESAAAIDAAGTTTYTAEAARRHQRLTGLTARSPS